MLTRPELRTRTKPPIVVALWGALAGAVAGLAVWGGIRAHEADERRAALYAPIEHDQPSPARTEHPLPRGDGGCYRGWHHLTPRGWECTFPDSGDITSVTAGSGLTTESLVIDNLDLSWTPPETFSTLSISHHEYAEIRFSGRYDCKLDDGKWTCTRKAAP